MIGIAIQIAVAIAAIDITRKIVDLLARKRHWRVGRWGRVLCIWQRVGETCLCCHTDFRYVLAHPIVYTGETTESARAMYPLCQSCWRKTGETERLFWAGRILIAWRDDGHYVDRDDLWHDHREAVYMDIVAQTRAGL